MAVVWRALDTQLKRTVAVKVLHAHLHARAEVRKRFDREAHAVARLHHPHILDVYDFSGPEADPSYLVIEFINGQTLRTFAEQHSFDPPELAVAALVPIAEALAHAHAAGVVHRDLKPENVMVRNDGVLKLTDFGIAALLDPDEKFTVTGSILGSPAHLAPETIEGKPIDPRADLFSFGTILYWLSCGELPYQAPSPAALLRNILEGNRKDPRQICPSIGDAQAKIIAHCLENDPAKRYQSATELKDDLLALLADVGITDAAGEVAAFVKAPVERAAAVRARLVERALQVGEAHLAEGKTSAALSSFGRALALDPKNQEAKSRVDRIRRRDRLLKLGQRASIALLAAGVLGAGAVRMGRGVRETRSAMLAKVHTDADLSRAALLAEWRAADEARARKEAAPRLPPPPAEPGKKQRRPARIQVQATPVPAALKVRLHTRYVAEVTVDGRFLGKSNMFDVELTPGEHKALVHSECCGDLQQPLVVSRNRVDDVYQLRFGNPYPAQLKTVNAPPGAQVFVDGAYLGAAPDLPAYSMNEPTRDVTVTIGDRTLRMNLRAGVVNTLDFTRAALK